jgi:hypothetical protein
MGGMGLVRLSTEAEIVCEGYAQIDTQHETQNEIVDAKRAEEALHIFFRAAWPTTKRLFLEMVLGPSRLRAAPPLRVWSVAKPTN